MGAARNAANDANPARIAETHVSTVFFVGDRVYKLKKPLKTGFLDWSTPQLRRRACEEEVALNRRLAPDVYLGVAEVTGPGGDDCDSLVVMRRLPADRSLASLVRSGSDVSDALRSVARVVAAFHAGCRHDAEVAAAGSAEEVLRKWDANTEEMAPYARRGLIDGRVLDQVSVDSRAYVSGRSDLFARRVSAGRIRDGHGDLLADDIFVLEDGVRILDCLEFDPNLRYGDVLADVAFLSMDLERLGAPEQAAAFLRWYREFSADDWPASLAHHWVAHRAQVRSKVACMRAEQGDAEAAGEAAFLLDLCRRHLRHATLRLVLVGGLPGTGKTTVAGAMADRLGWALLSSDELRHEMAENQMPENSKASGAGAYRSGLYSAESTEATYRGLLRSADRAVALGQSVIIDASWTDSRWREEAASLAERRRCTLIEIECTAPAAVAEARIRDRLAAGGDASDATPEIRRRMASDAAPWPTALRVDTGEGSDKAVAGALSAANPDWASDLLGH